MMALLLAAMVAWCRGRIFFFARPTGHLQHVMVGKVFSAGLLEELDMNGLIGVGSIVLSSAIGLGLSLGAMWIILSFTGDGTG